MHFWISKITYDFIYKTPTAGMNDTTEFSELILDRRKYQLVLIHRSQEGANIPSDTVCNARATAAARWQHGPP